MIGLFDWLDDLGILEQCDLLSLARPDLPPEGAAKKWTAARKSNAAVGKLWVKYTVKQQSAEIECSCLRGTLLAYNGCGVTRRILGFPLDFGVPHSDGCLLASETFQETQASIEMISGSSFSARKSHPDARCAGIHSRENDGN
jgi:hypothetical protein